MVGQGVKRICMVGGKPQRGVKRGERVESQLLFEPIVNKEGLVNDPHFRPDGASLSPRAYG